MYAWLYANPSSCLNKLYIYIYIYNKVIPGWNNNARKLREDALS